MSETKVYEAFKQVNQGTYIESWIQEGGSLVFFLVMIGVGYTLWVPLKLGGWAILVTLLLYPVINSIWTILLSTIGLPFKKKALVGVKEMVNLGVLPVDIMEKLPMNRLALWPPIIAQIISEGTMDYKQYLEHLEMLAARENSRKRY